MSLAVFIIPDSSISQKIIKWKNIVIESKVDQTYAAHPPHLTLININVNRYRKAIRAIEQLVDTVSSFDITIDRKDIFYDDIFTGGHTSFYGIRKNSNLNALQLSLANVLKVYKNEDKPPEKIIKDRRLYDSYLKYGFPFIGEHWIPHFSIASLKIEKSDIFFQKFLSNQNIYKIYIKQISVWHVSEDIHTLIKNIDLK